jgi:transposase
MPKKLQLHPHLTTVELERRYRQADHPVERSHYQIIWLLSQGWLTRDVMAATGYSANWVREVARRYNTAGPAGLGDGRRGNAGQPALLTRDQQAHLRQALSAPPPGGGVWSGPRVAAWMGEQLGRPVAAQRGWDYLQRLAYTLQVPRPAHVKADPAAQAAFKQTSPTR